ncbi:MAG: hypothetical protein JNK82_03915 [Myxococcaceae bacterium]|nr:hypothetical protein [Myxococcaceae bacterium]
MPPLTQPCPQGTFGYWRMNRDTSPPFATITLSPDRSNPLKARFSLERGDKTITGTADIAREPTGRDHHLGNVITLRPDDASVSLAPSKLEYAHGYDGVVQFFSSAADDRSWHFKAAP